MYPKARNAGVKKNYKKKKVARKSATVVRVEKQLMENFVSLQKVLTHLSGNFNTMNNRLSDFLDLFEDSAKAFVKTSAPAANAEDNWQKEIINKIDNLFEQNKVLARGLTLIHDEALSVNNLSPSIVTSPIVAVPVKARPTKNTLGKMETGENIKLNNKPRVKEEPDFDIQSPPFSLER